MNKQTINSVFPRLVEKYLEEKDGIVYEVSTYEKRTAISSDQIEKKKLALQEQLTKLEATKGEATKLEVSAVAEVAESINVK